MNDRQFGVGFVLALLVQLVLVAVVIWAIVQLVQWVTTK